MRPLDRLPSIKLKLGVAIVVAVAVSTTVSLVGFRFGVPLWLRPLIAVTIALGMVQLLAHGMTSPLRQMAHAATSMAAGRHDVRVTATSADEVGELARAFNAMAAQLAEVDRFRRDLVANASHELRTPISALQAKLENLVDGVETPDQEALAAMLKQVERLGRLVAQLLDLSRLESGALPLQRQPFPVAEVLDDVADVCRSQRHVAVDVVVDPDDLHAYGDQERIHQVVTNLADNAMRHSPPDGTVVLRAFARGGSVTIEVADQGPGIEEADAERVFERFYRADGARSAGGGAGLGLAIARWIVDLHGGRIRPEPAQPTGCRMVVELPARGAAS